MYANNPNKIKGIESEKNIPVPLLKSLQIFFRCPTLQLRKTDKHIDFGGTDFDIENDNIRLFTIDYKFGTSPNNNPTLTFISNEGFRYDNKDNLPHFLVYYKDDWDHFKFIQWKRFYELINKHKIGIIPSYFDNSQFIKSVDFVLEHEKEFNKNEYFLIPFII